jgi:hypothetical protein
MTERIRKIVLIVSRKLFSFVLGVFSIFKTDFPICRVYDCVRIRLTAPVDTFDRGIGQRRLCDNPRSPNGVFSLNGRQRLFGKNVVTREIIL